MASYLEREHQLGGIEAYHTLREALVAAEVEKELPPRAVVQHQVQLVVRLAIGHVDWCVFVNGFE